MEREANKRKGAGQQEFEVREYILPRFEVLINSPPSAITYNQEGDRSVQKIPIGICAKYVDCKLALKSFLFNSIILKLRL